LNTYLIIKWVHIVSATILFGTGLGTAFFKWMTDRSGHVGAIRVVSDRTVLADWIFTTPAGVIQLVTGLLMVHMAGFPWDTGWVLLSIGLYLFAGLCWLPVVVLQLWMRQLAIVADTKNSPLPPIYWRYARIWFWLGVPAFTALIGVYWLMVMKPVLA
jgi:uncharacterized membrane protein